MLNEIVRNVGYDNILKHVQNDIDFSNSLNIRLRIDGSSIREDDILYVKKEIDISKLEISDWFKNREIYSNRIMPNKSIIGGGKYPKFISSCNSNVIIFNWDNFVNHKKTNEVGDLKESFVIMVEEFLLKLNCNDKLSIYENNFDEVYEYINSNKLSKFIIRLFLYCDIDEYKNEYLNYLKDNIFDADTINSIDNIEKGRVSLFYSLNSKKPFLSHMLKNNDEIHLLNSQEAEQTLQLKKYMDSIKSEIINLEVGSINYKMDFNSSTKKWFLDDYSTNPFQNNDNIKSFDIINIMELSKYNENKIISKKCFNKAILSLLDFKVKGYYSDNDRTDNKFKTFSIIYYKHIKDIDLNVFRRVYKNMIREIYRLYFNEDNMYKISSIINFDICISDYLFKTNIKEEVKNMIEKIKSKIVYMDKKESYEIEDDFEFYMLCGQLSKHLKSKTQTDKITNNLFYEYNMATRTNKLIDILQRDKVKFDYNETNNNRAGKILFGINDYFTNNETRLKNIDKIRFNMGLYYGQNLLYTSNKNNNDNNKGDK